MPRLSPKYVHRAKIISPYLASLLRPCRDLELAQNELRWLKEHSIKKTEELSGRLVSTEHVGNLRLNTVRKRQDRSQSPLSRKKVISGWRSLLAYYVSRRARGVPLQYIIGTQPFGELDILCERGVLIPRPETEQIVRETANLIEKEFLSARNRRAQRAAYRSDREASKDLKPLDGVHVQSELTILDLCTGTGCIPLLLCDILSKSKWNQTVALKFYGFDISPYALHLARRNRRSTLPNLPPNSKIRFFRGNVLDTALPGTPLQSTTADEKAFDALSAPPPILCALHHILPSLENTPPKIDVIISNPPYVSPTAYSNGTTNRSVRRYEPELALVPPAIVSGVVRGDEFYAKIVEVAKYTKAKLVVFEVGDPTQAQRVKKMMVDDGWEGKMDVWDIGEEEGVRAVVGLRHCE